MYEPKIPPAQLFKYCSLAGEKFDWLLSIIENNKIYFSRADQFNDPFDSRPNYRFPVDIEGFFYDVLTRRKPEWSEQDRRSDAHFRAEKFRRDPDAFIEETRSTQNIVIQNYGIFSLSADDSNPLMWSHYADAHRGVCLGFSTRSKEFPFYGAYQVVYRKRYPVVPFDSDDPFEPIKSTFLVKYSDWSYEREWRLIEKAKIGLQPIPSQSLVSIILGTRIDQKKREIILTKAKQRTVPMHLMDARLSSSRFALDFFQIPS